MQVVSKRNLRKEAPFFVHYLLLKLIMAKPLVKHFINLTLLLVVAFLIRHLSTIIFDTYSHPVVLFITSLAVLGVGAFYILRNSAEIIEETTEILSEKTKIAGGLLQSLGTAFPDMILGVTAAVVSLGLQKTDMTRAINYAVIAASTTFGSNIYNVGHAAWCIFRQNLANTKQKTVLMFPLLNKVGLLSPMKDHRKKPLLEEIDTANNILVALTLLTLFVAVVMVIFGKVANPPSGTQEDLYQLIKPAGVFILIASVTTLYLFRKSKRAVGGEEIVEEEENYYRHHKMIIIWISLIVSGISILFAAESMVKAIEIICQVTGMPFVIAGVMAGVIGCLGEILVVHNFSVNPNGRIGDAIVGVAMDNIVTICGASIVAIMGGIFLGGSSLILIFVIILALNTILIWQISNLKNFFIEVKTNS